jgi:hypothetical protein
MKAICQLVAISKQAVDQYHQKALVKQREAQEFIEKADAIRNHHPMMGCRKMALKTKRQGWGRDKVEQLLLGSGYKIIYPPNYIKTTRPQYDLIFPNLIEGIRLNGINQVVQTDISYIWINGCFYYLVFIIDVYSRRIVSYHAGENMEASANIRALKMMMRTRKEQCLKGMIHHSDRGSQYTSKIYLTMLGENKIKISMCKHAWENAYTERINRTIKEEYLAHWKIETYDQLKKAVAKAVRRYNEERPHWNLPMQLSPVQFENYVNKLAKSRRPEMQLYKASQQL